jgi:hypothetical protein
MSHATFRGVLLAAVALLSGTAGAVGPAGPISASTPVSASASASAHLSASADRPDPLPAAGDRLTVTVRHAGDADGTYRLRYHPSGGTHPDAGGACATLDRRTTWGRDPFAPVPPDSICTMRYGGPATAHVTGTWAGRPVEATYGRGNGCETARWDELVPVLPDLRRN